MFNYQRSRDQLDWHILEEVAINRWLLVLKKPYDEIFDALFPQIKTGCLAEDWSDTKKGHRKCFLRDLDSSYQEQMDRFFSAYEHFVLISLNKNIEPHFSNELDVCIALDFHSSKEDDEITKTEVGQHVYEAKHENKHKSIEWLKARLELSLEWVPWNAVKGEWSLTYMPYLDSKGFDLPSYLATSLIGSTPHNWPINASLPLIDVRTSFEKKPIKDVPVAEKLEEFEKLLEKTSIHESIEGLNCCIIDDLYQSGTSVWSYAKWLKSNGANCVFALVCSKTMRDSDNM